MGARTVFTIGYGGKDLEQFIGELSSAGVRRVVDVRELPLSRKRGFSKTALREALSDAGIEYVHLRCAGNPFRAEKDDVARCLAKYASFLARHDEVLEEVERATNGTRSALLCAERDHQSCHRAVLAARVTARNPSVKVRHL